MAPKGTKRALASQGADAKKKCKLVADALANHPMLATVVPSTLGVYADVRHAYQSRFVTMMGETMASMGGELAEAEAAAKAKVDGAEAEKVARESAAASAQEAETAKKEAFNEKEAAAKAAAVELKAAAQALKVAEAAEKSGDAAFLEAEKSKQMVETTAASISQLKEAVGGTSEVKAVVAACKKLGVDEELLNYLPESLKKEPVNRGPFDAIVMKSIDEVVAKSLSELTEVVANGESDKSARAAATEGAKAAEAAASEKLSASRAACIEVFGELSEATKALKQAQLAVSSYASDMKQACKELTEATKALAAFQDGALAAFNALKDQSTPPPPEEPKVVDIVAETAPAIEVAA